MSQLAQLTAFAVLIVGIFVVGIYMVRDMNTRVRVLGWNNGRVAFRRLKMNGKGGVTWKNKDGSKCHLVLDAGFSHPSEQPSGPIYFADVSEGQGRLIRLAGIGQDNSFDVLGLDGYRLWNGLFGGGLKDIADAQRTDIQGTLKMLLIGGGVMLAIIVGALVYVIRLMNQANQAGVPV